MSQQKAFTLVELLVTTAVIGILSAISIAGYRQFADSAKKAQMVMALNSFVTASQVARDMAADRMGPVATNFTVQWWPSRPINDGRLQVSATIGGAGGTSNFNILSPDEIAQIYSRDILDPPAGWGGLTDYSEQMNTGSGGAHPHTYGLAFQLIDCSITDRNHNYYVQYSYTWTDGSQYNTKPQWLSAACP